MRDLPIAYGNSRHEKHWVNKTIRYEDLKERLRVTIRTTESAEEYAGMVKGRRDNIKRVYTGCLPEDPVRGLYADLQSRDQVRFTSCIQRSAGHREIDPDQQTWDGVVLGQPDPLRYER